MNQTGISRPARVAEEIHKTLSLLLLSNVKDPRLQNLNLTYCKVSKDLSIVNVHFTCIGLNENDYEVSEAKKALEKAKGFFRSEIGKKMKLRIVPEVRFYYDSTAENASYIDALIDKALH